MGSVGYQSVVGVDLGPGKLEILQEQSSADVPDDEVIERIGGWQELRNRAEAGLIREQFEFAWCRLAHPGRPVGVRLPPVAQFAADEVGLALRLAPRTAAARFETALTLADRLPRVVNAMWAGTIDYTRADAIASETLHLSDEDAARIADEVLDGIKDKTTGQVRAQTRKAAVAIRPKETVKAAKKRARQDQDVKAFDLGDGNADLTAVMDSGMAAMIMTILNSAAWQAKKADHAESKNDHSKNVRSIAACRVDAFIDLILGRLQTTAPTQPDDTSTTSTGAAQGDRLDEGVSEPARKRAPESPSVVKPVVNVTLSLAEFLKLFQATKNTTQTSTGAHDDEPEHEGECSGGVGEIEGLGYVPAWVARNLLADFMNQSGTGFRAVIFDEETGTFLAASSTSYRLPAALERHIQLRDNTCRFPGCRQPAKRCDVDHAKPWHQGGSTAECNLHCLCRHHHRLKQSPGWRVTFEDGISTWTTRTGHTYTTRPYDYRQPPTPPPPLPRRHGTPPPDEPPPDDTDLSGAD